MEKDSKKTLWLIIGGFIVICALVAGAIFLLDRHRSNNARNKLLEAQQAKFEATATADPILNYLPYGGVGWRIDPTFEQKNNQRVLVLVVSVVLYGSDYKLSPADMQALIAKNEANALGYIKSSGFDPAKYTIEYVVPSH